ncbi:MAG: extracellular solute-binding protein [Sphingomonadaceae bacterium]
MRIGPLLAATLALLISACGGRDEAEQETLTIYSSRHYDSDYALYEAFERETGIEVRAIEADGDLLIERIKADGPRAPADIIVTVDAGRLWRAEREGLFAPADSATLAERVPTNLRHPEGLWYGLSKRARAIVYAADRVDEEELAGYQSLADPALEGRVCARSSGNIYNISLLAALIERWGETRAREWAEGVARNLARNPVGGDSDQIKAVAAGECDVALVNHYYFARLLRDEPETVEGLDIFWPEDGPGVHVNISGAGIARDAPNPDLARRFLEFATSPEAQRFFAELTNEYPAVADTPYRNAALARLGDFKADPLSATRLGANQARAQRIFDRAGWP